MIGNLKGYTTPACDLDGRPNSFNPAEQAAITEIWARVADAFAPFNVNVTTSNNGPRTNTFNKVLSVDIGGTADSRFRWQNIAGIASLGSFTVSNGASTGWATTSNGVTGDPVSGPDAEQMFGEGSGTCNVFLYCTPDLVEEGTNTVLIFSDYLKTVAPAEQYAHTVANAVNHEAGVAFRLYSDRAVSTDNPYFPWNDFALNPAVGGQANIMGDNLFAPRATWGVSKAGWEEYGGRMFGGVIYQNDEEVLAGVLGYRPRQVTPLRPDGLRMSANGFIGYDYSQDVYSFTTIDGNVRVTLDGPASGSKLVGTLSLWSATDPIATAGMTYDVNHAEINALLAAGTYFVRVGSVGFNNVGNYTVAVQHPWELERAKGVDVSSYLGVGNPYTLAGSATPAGNAFPDLLASGLAL